MAAYDGKVRIGIVAPACPLTPSLAARVEALARQAYPGRVELVFHPQCFLSDGHFAGPDAVRAEALVDVANDPAFDALWFARGGYGSFRLLEAAMPRLADVARRKTYLGYSDLGSLLAALYRAGFPHVAHGPMPVDVKRPGGEATVRRALAYLMGDGRDGVEGTARSGAPVAAFNLTILAHLLGTPWLPDLSGHVLMLEEVSEPMYRIDRCLGSVFSAPALRGLAGVRLGRVSDIVPNEPDFLHGEEDLVRFWCARAAIPYLGRADIGHDVGNKIVPFGRPES